MNVILIGSGNTATVLGKKISTCGHQVVQVWSRNLQHAEELAQQLKCEAISSLKEIATDADICILAVADSAIPEIADQIRFKKQLVVHTAGSVNMDILKNASPNYGIFYPLQSLRKEMTEFPEIPILVDGNSNDVKVLLTDFASSFSKNVHVADDTTRLQLHLAAVFVSNFSNHLYALMDDYCKQQQLSFDLLLPLITEVGTRLKHGDAKELQTGPARRGDVTTIQKHLLQLKDKPQLQKLYQHFTESIELMYHKK